MSSDRNDGISSRACGTRVVTAVRRGVSPSIVVAAGRDADVGERSEDQRFRVCDTVLAGDVVIGIQRWWV